MNFFEFLLSRYLGGGSGSGSGVKKIPITISENGKYVAPSGKAYSPVTVNVECPPPTILKTLNVSENGEYEAEEGRAYKKVNVDVPKNIIPFTFTQNGTYDAPLGYDADGFSPVTVDVPQYGELCHVTVEIKSNQGQITEAYPIIIIGQRGDGYYDNMFMGRIISPSGLANIGACPKLDLSLPYPYNILITGGYYKNHYDLSEESTNCRLKYQTGKSGSGAQFHYMVVEVTPGAVVKVIVTTDD